MRRFSPQYRDLGDGPGTRLERRERRRPAHHYDYVDPSSVRQTGWQSLRRSPGWTVGSDAFDLGGAPVSDRPLERVFRITPAGAAPAAVTPPASGPPMSRSGVQPRSQR